MWRIYVPRTGRSNMVHVFVLGSSLAMRSEVHRLPHTLCLLSTVMWYGCIVGSGNGMMRVSIVLVSMRAKFAPHELPTHSTFAFLSVPMRRGPCAHGVGALKPRSVTFS